MLKILVELSYAVITRESLKLDKAFQKLLKKQLRDLELLNKKQQKEKTCMNKQHCIMVDKVLVSHDKEKTATEKKLKKKA